MAVTGKKGIFFTFSAIVLAIIVIFAFNVYTGYTLNDKMQVTEIRINTMNNFVKDLENGIEDAIYISGFRGLLSLEDYMMENDKFFDGILAPSLDSAFEEAFSSGTITFEGDTEDMPLMKGHTFLNWTHRIKVEANKTGIVLEFTINDIDIRHTEPWMVDVDVDMIVNIMDKKNTASWTLNRVFTEKINITSEEGEKRFVDPLYLIKTNGIVNNTIRKTTVPDFSTIGNLQTHADNSYYAANTDAPSYLMRFKNDLGSSAYGIESLADVETLLGLGYGPGFKTAVDYLYFDPFSSTTDCNVKFMGVSYDWFYLDYQPDPPNHLEFYGDQSCG